MKRMILFFFSTITLQIPQLSLAMGCHVVMAGKDIARLSQLNFNQQFVGYFAQLYQLGTITPASAQNFVSELRRGQWTNPIASEQPSGDPIFLDVGSQIHHETFAHYFATGKLELSSVLREIEALLQSSHQQMEDRKVIAGKTRATLLGPMERFEPATFQFKGKTIRLTHALDVMQAPVTRAQWHEIMGDLPETTPGRDLAGIPVTNMTLLSAFGFANQCSLIEGLTPVYRRDGSFEPFQSDRVGRTKFHRVDSVSSEPYRVDGYRLPTKAEQLYLLSNLGTNWRQPMGLSPLDLALRAQLKGNSGSSAPGVVDQRLAFDIGGRKLFALFGNVYTWNSDADFDFADDSTDPFEDHDYTHLSHSSTIYGLSVSTQTEPWVWVDRPLKVLADGQGTDLGVRLVRTVLNSGD